MQPVGFGIVGAGAVARLHAEAIAAVPEARLVAVYDAVPERAAAFAAEVGAAAESSMAAFLARADVEAVTVATPSGAHLEVAEVAAAAGKHLLCEKPLEVTVERCDRIIAACDRAGVRLGCVFQSRTRPNARRIREAVQAGRFGKLILVDAQVKWYRDDAYYGSSGWRGTWRLDGGGALMNQGIHAVDLLLWYGGPPRSVCAYTDTMIHPRIEVEDTAVAVVRFANGAMGTIQASTACAPGFPRRLEISGSRGTVTMEDDRLVRWDFADPTPDDARILAEGQAVAAPVGGAREAMAISNAGHAAQIADLARAIREGREPLVPGREARRAVALITAIYASARSGMPVPLS